MHTLIMIAAVLAFLSGILLVQQFPTLPTWLHAVVVGAVLGVVLRRHRFLLYMLLGALWAITFATIRVDDRLPADVEGEPLTITGRIVGFPVRNEQSIRFDFAPESAKKTLPSRLRLSWFNAEHPLRPGQRWRLSVKLKRPHGTLNPGGFDYERWLFSAGIGATGYVRRQSSAQLLNEGKLFALDPIRQNIAERLSKRIDDTKFLALVRALTLGDGSQIPPALWELFRITGTTHLFVISGSHIALIASLIFALTRKLWSIIGGLRWPPSNVAAIAAIGAAVFYALLSGFAVPSQRAAIMLSAALAAATLCRQSRPSNTLAIALAAVLTAEPLAVLAPGFWLSFAAVALILYALSGRLRKPGFWRGAIKLHWTISLGLAPFLLIFFQQVSLASPFANLIAVPFVSFLILPWSLLALLLLPLSPTLADWLLAIPCFFLQWLLWILTKIAELPNAMLSGPSPSIAALLFAIPSFLLLLSPFGTPSRWLAAIFLLPLIFNGDNPPKLGEIRLTLLDVGQGLSVSVQTAGHWLLFDTGPQFNSGTDMGANVVLPFLREHGVNRLDTLVVSHGDNDHIGGARSILQNLPVSNVMTSVPEQLALYTPKQCAIGQHWEWDGVSFEMLGPIRIDPNNENDNSCVLHIKSAFGSLLLTGDIEADAERRLIEHYGDSLQADLLIAPHHGSKTSSTADFLKKVNPRYVLIPSGYRNSFGHPHPTVLTRYRVIGAQWYTSADSGAIFANLSAQGIRIDTYREQYRRYWHFRR